MWLLVATDIPLQDLVFLLLVQAFALAVREAPVWMKIESPRNICVLCPIQK